MTAALRYQPYRPAIYHGLWDGWAHITGTTGQRLCYTALLDCGHELVIGGQSLADLPRQAAWLTRRVDSLQRAPRSLRMRCEECPPLPRGIVYLMHSARCRTCGTTIAPAGRIGTPARYHSVDEPAEGIAPTSRYSHWPGCPTTIDVDPAGLAMMLGPGISLQGTVAYLHLMRLSRATAEPVPAAHESEFAALLAEANDLAAGGFQPRLAGGCANDRQLGEVDFAIRAFYARYPGRDVMAAADVAAWYRLHRRALKEIHHGQ